MPCAGFFQSNAKIAHTIPLDFFSTVAATYWKWGLRSGGWGRAAVLLEGLEQGGGFVGGIEAGMRCGGGAGVEAREVLGKKEFGMGGWVIG